VIANGDRAFARIPFDENLLVIRTLFKRTSDLFPPHLLSSYLPKLHNTNLSHHPKNLAPLEKLNCPGWLTAAPAIVLSIPYTHTIQTSRIALLIETNLKTVWTTKTRNARSAFVYSQLSRLAIRITLRVMAPGTVLIVDACS
jgi:hypothetical protein